MSELETLNTLVDEREFRKAEMLASRILRQNNGMNDEAQILFVRARIRLLTGRPDEALSDLSDISADSHVVDTASYLELIGDAHLARFEAAQVGLAERNDIHNAQKLYRRIIDEYPSYYNLGWVYYQYGRTMLIVDQIDEAEVLFRRALFAPSHIRSLTAYCFERLGFITFYERRLPQEALYLLDKAIHTYPISENQAWTIHTHLLQARVAHTFDSTKALNYIQLAHDTAASDSTLERPVHAEILFTEAEILSSQPGQDALIIDVLQEFFQMATSPPGLDVTWSRAYEMLGNAYQRIRRYQSAVNAFENAVRYNPDHPWYDIIQYRIATCLLQMNQHDASIQRLKTILRSDQNHVNHFEVNILLGDAYRGQGNLKEAMNYYQIAVDDISVQSDTSRSEHVKALLETIRNELSL